METYGGGPRPSFNLMGVLVERQKRLEVVELAARSVMYCAAFIMKDFVRQFLAEWEGRL